MKVRLSFYLLFIGCYLLSAQDTSRIVKGTITDGSLPLANVQVSVNDKGQGTYSDSSGKYAIEAKQRQRLTFSFNGMRTHEIVVEDVTRIMNITMYPEFEQLEEVVVNQKRANSQRELEMEYFENKDLIKTVFGIIDTKRSNFTLRVLQAENLNKATFFIHDAMQSLIPGLRIKRDSTNPSIKNAFLRGSIYPAVYEVNGMLFENIDWLAIDEIYRIGVILPGIGTQKYGLRASGGVIVVNTKGGANILAQSIKEKSWNKGSSFDNALTDVDIRNNWPTYLKELYASNSVEQAKEVYEGGKKIHNANPYYFIDAHQYFLAKWKNTIIAQKVFSDAYVLFEKNAELLKAIAYINDVYGSTKTSNELYQEVYKLRPNYSQSFRDLANSYRKNGNYSKAVNIYSRYNHVLEKGMLVDSISEFKKLANKEMYNLLDLEFDREVKAAKIGKSQSLEDNFSGTRLVFEWNNSNAEFEIEFLGKENLAHVWKHTEKDNPELLKEERILGYSSIAYLFDDNLDTELKVNLNYLGNMQLTPTYMKVTVFKDYGLPSQSSESKLYRLQLVNAAQQMVVLNDI
ncbi:MAG: hypothetical protein ACJA1P_001861 [Maribacter sp.]|jgi:hypothetical protein